MLLGSIFLAYLATISIVPLSVAQILEPKTPGFTVDLIHRSSTEPPSQRTVNALRRSFDRHNRLKALTCSEKTEAEILTTPTGEFLMKYSIGTPPVATYGIADTGSDLTWTQCPPCIECFKQKMPLFYPNKSSTYRRIPCKATTCRDIQLGSCSKSRRNCLYSELYGDGSTTEGELARDTLTLGSAEGQTVSFPNIKFGCGFKNTGIFSEDESGIAGLGAGRYSLVGQLHRSIQGKFSYCLVSMSSVTVHTSKLHFGTAAIVSGAGVVSTPLVLDSDNKLPFYFLTLQGITIGNQKLQVEEDEITGSKQRPVEGNMIIDSGTTLTFLPYRLYEKVESVVKSTIKMKPAEDPLGVLDVCYYTPKKDLEFPDMVVHFKGADVSLKTENAFIMTNNVTTCLALKSSMDFPIFGNLAQMNFLVGYDLQKRTVSFKPTDCSRSV